MNIPELIKEAHETAFEKGFYDCPECEDKERWKSSFVTEDKCCQQDDKGYDRPNDNTMICRGCRAVYKKIKCSSCNGTRKNQNKNIGELLMLVVTELSEALEAHRSGRFADWDEFRILREEKTTWTKESIFEESIKDTFEDEIADVFIRLFDLCGYIKLDIDNCIPYTDIRWKSDNVAQSIRQICKYFDNLDEDRLTNFDLKGGYDWIMAFAEKNNIPIDKHIQAKMNYNRTRERKHGKRY